MPYQITILRQQKNNKPFFSYLLILAIFCTATTHAAPRKSNHSPLYEKLSAALTNAKNGESQNPPPPPQQKPTLEKIRLSPSDQEKCKALYEEIAADATLFEKTTKLAVLASAAFFAQKLYIPYSSQIPNPRIFNNERLDQAKTYFIHLTLYLLFYYQFVTEDRMSRPLAGLMLLGFYPKWLRGIFFYLILHKLFCSTSKEKLAAFLNHDEEGWAEARSAIPSVLQEEFDQLYDLFIQNQAIVLSTSEINRLTKKLKVLAASSSK